MVNNWLHTIQSLVYPPTCILCGAPGDKEQDLCVNCRHDLPHNTNPCLKCALPLPATTSSICGQCQQQPPQYNLCLAAFRYEYPLEHLVSGFKFRDKLAYGRLLSTLLGDYLEQRSEIPELLIPVPLHSARLRERGFNQALELARPLSQRFDIPIDSHTAIRNRPTVSQLGLNKQERRCNIRGAFELAGKLTAKHIAIIDDVVTTGNTVSELAAVLLRSGVTRVDVWAVGRRAHHGN
ncbi:Competence protein F homolog, phosphoribosyltransferase domain; protein YhgH required for utilization of DNA as sole source of carbon and energy [hydrothermal vent metagenome]|uniref:Competence protein F homolog, phosphoribosyltransferase domain protein YhgH required for utilization of DNA as sole source of carbon and energy n=1 Tax=hydrothermal vent metagenome TaxID=652676 RepID=A0A3B1B006_9ZZZZ